MILAGLCIISAVFLPVWRIELDAPQYPEGLALQIYSNRLAGDVEIINGLNHYIGMKTLHAEEFVEFKVLPYIIGFFGLWAIVTGLFFRTRRSVLIYLVTFAAFGILAMYDFWRWEYEYGHNLNPTAAIQVPGMAYQPPLIGFRQLLNFGAFSIPAIGGWLMLAGGLLAGLVYVTEAGLLGRFFKKRGAALLLMLPLVATLSCKPDGPEPIALNKDNCAFCKMDISDGHFAAELITKKGRIFKFDDLSCLLKYKGENSDMEVLSCYVNYYPGNNELIPAETAHYIKGGTLRSPMAGNIAAFKTEEEANEYMLKLQAEVTNWQSMTPQ